MKLLLAGLSIFLTSTLVQAKPSNDPRLLAKPAHDKNIPLPPISDEVNHSTKYPKFVARPESSTPVLDTPEEVKKEIKEKKWIEKLGDEEFDKREEAAAKLKEFGRPALRYIKQRLDEEMGKPEYLRDLERITRLKDVFLALAPRASWSELRRAMYWKGMDSKPQKGLQALTKLFSFDNATPDQLKERNALKSLCQDNDAERIKRSKKNREPGALVERRSIQEYEFPDTARRIITLFDGILKEQGYTLRPTDAKFPESREISKDGQSLVIVYDEFCRVRVNAKEAISFTPEATLPKEVLLPEPPTTKSPLEVGFSLIANLRTDDLHVAWTMDGYPAFHPFELFDDYLENRYHGYTRFSAQTPGTLK